MPANLVKAQVRLDLSGLGRVASRAKQSAIALKAVKAGAKLVQARAKQLAPRRTGKGGSGLKQSIGVKSVKGTKGNSSLALAVIGARMKVVRMVPHGKKTVKHVPGFISHIIDAGARPHSVNPGAKLARKGTGQKSSGQGGGMHPGTKPTHFLRDAWEGTRAAAGKAAVATLADEINKAIAKEAARQRKV